MPQALFVTHVHLDHVAGFERLFVDTFFNAHRRGKVRLYVPATVVPLLHSASGITRTCWPRAVRTSGMPSS